MIHSESRGIYQTIQRDVRQDTPSLLIESKRSSDQAPLTPKNIAPQEPLHSDGALLENPFLERLTLEGLEAIIPDEYDPLTSWTAWKLCLDYGVRDLPHPSLPDVPHLKIV